MLGVLFWFFNFAVWLSAAFIFGEDKFKVSFCNYVSGLNLKSSHQFLEKILSEIWDHLVQWGKNVLELHLLLAVGICHRKYTDRHQVSEFQLSLEMRDYFRRLRFWSQTVIARNDFSHRCYSEVVNLWLAAVFQRHSCHLCSLWPFFFLLSCLVLFKKSFCFV